MELDDIKQVWSTCFSGLEHRLAGVEAALADRTRRRYRRSLWPTAACAAIETAVAVALAVVVARPTLAQLDSWRYGIA
ncbi:MAG: hypothetical protein KDE27_25760, partial [Planctomycetes bacterium]|nr:hypothetical protein [Planctomycetota bacterium]